MPQSRTARWSRSLLALVLSVAACASGAEEEMFTPEESGSAAAVAVEGPEATPVEASDPSTAERPFEAYDGELRVALTGIRSLDPAMASPASVSEMMLADLLFDTLTELDDAGVVRPGLATPTANVDRSIWRFQLRADATFADGTAVTASDVVYSLDRIRSQGGTSLAGVTLGNVRSVTAVSDALVDIELSEPSAVLPEILSSASYGIVDQARMESARAGGDRTPNASGDYVARIESAVEVSLERRSGTGPASILLGLFEAASAAFDEFLDGGVHYSPIPPERMGEAIDKVGDGALVPFQGTVMLGLNTNAAPLDRRPLRRAIALSINRSTLSAAVFGPAATPLHGVLPAGVPGAGEECRAPCGPDLDQARALVAEAYEEEDPRPLRLLIDRSETHRSIAGVLEEQLTAVGLSVATSSLDAPTYDQLVSSGGQQLFVFSTLGVSRTPAVHLVPLFSSTSDDNIFGYANENVDAAMERALAEPIASVRAARWLDIERAILADVPVVPLAQLRTVGALAAGISGFNVRVDGTLDLSRFAAG